MRERERERERERGKKERDAFFACFIQPVHNKMTSGLPMFMKKKPTMSGKKKLRRKIEDL